MHDIKSIRDNPQAFDAALKRRGLEPMSASLLAIDELRRARIRVSESFQARRNAVSKEIGDAKKAKDDKRAAELMGEVAEIKKSISTLETEEKESSKELYNALAAIPNLPLDDVPPGVDERGNMQRHVFGKIRNYAFNPKPHDDLGGALRQMDFEAAAKLSGARFVVLKKGLARLERAIGQFMLDLHTGQHGYTEINPPLLVRDATMFGTGQLPKFEDDQFEATGEFRSLYMKFERENAIFKERRAANDILSGLNKFLSESMREAIGSGKDVAWVAPAFGKLKNIFETYSSDFGKFSEEFGQFASEFMRLGSQGVGNRLWLIPTAEVPLTNLVRESILDEKELPLRFTALTPCFRAEAGAAGRDTRGMIRQHQFTKVELVSITTPETSRDEHERMLACAEEVLRQLDLHYRVMTLCAGDMGFSAQKTYDIEVWMPGQGEGGAYREISSCSVCGDFQARRMDARYRGPDNKPRFVHTLNGSGTAVGRALIAVMETYQQEDGSIAVPDVLQPYMGGLKTVQKDNH
jgi:seryl-tRNA synthetase